MTSYEPVYPGGWRDKPDTSTPIDAAALDHLEAGIEAALAAALAAAPMTTSAVKSAAYTSVGNEIVPADATSAGFTVKLPNGPLDATRVIVKKIDASANAVTVQCQGSAVLNKAAGSTSMSLTLTNQAVFLQYKAAGAIWYIVSDDLPLSSLNSVYEPIGANAIQTTDATVVAGAGAKGQFAKATDTGLLYRHDGTKWRRIDGAVNALSVVSDPTNAASTVAELDALARALKTRYGGGEIYLPNSVQWAMKAITDTQNEFLQTITWTRPALVIRHKIAWRGEDTELTWTDTAGNSILGVHPAARVPHPPWLTDGHSSPRATVTADIAAGDSTFTVDSSASFTVGSQALLRLGMNPGDANEPQWVGYGTVVAIPDATHITLDIQAEIPIVIAQQTVDPSGTGPIWVYQPGGTDNPGAHGIYLVDELPDGHAEGFVLNSKDSSHHPTMGATLYYGPGASLRNIVSRDGGYLSVGYATDVHVDHWHQIGSSQWGSPSLGRVIDVASGSRNIVADHVTGERFEGVPIFVESYARLTMRKLQLLNNHTSRVNTTQPLIEAVGGSHIDIDGLDVSGTGTILRAVQTNNDELVRPIVIRGRVTIRTGTPMLSIPPKILDDGVILDNGNVYDAGGAARYDRERRFRRVVMLKPSTPVTIQLPDGLLSRGTIYASTLTGLANVLFRNGVTADVSMLAFLTAGQTTVVPNGVTNVGTSGGTPFWGSYRTGRTLYISPDGTVPPGAYLIVDLGYMPPGKPEATSSPASTTADADIALAAVDAFRAQSLLARATVANTTTETVLASFTVPSPAVVPGLVCRLTAYGVNDYKATSGILTYQWRWGGLTGQVLATAALASQTSLGTQRSWTMMADLTFRTVAGGATQYAFGGPVCLLGQTSNLIGNIAGSQGVLDASVDQQLVLTATWATADAANIARCDSANLTMNGGTLVRG